MKPVQLRDLASADMADAARWYEDQQEGLGADFVAEVERVLARVGGLPKQFPVLYRGTRRALLRRFPYAVFFVEQDEVIVIVAVAHQAADPRGWRARAL